MFVLRISFTNQERTKKKMVRNKPRISKDNACPNSRYTRLKEQKIEILEVAGRNRSRHQETKQDIHICLMNTIILFHF
jgi:hypothetical protein